MSTSLVVHAAPEKNWSVKGTLFSDYVRMIRGTKHVDWSHHLVAQDLPFLEQKIDTDGWYPMATFERFGQAIFAEVAGRDCEAVREWGRMQVFSLAHVHPNLVAPDDPVETLMRFKVLRSTFFDFEAFQIPSITDGDATLLVSYGMGPVAEEAAAHQLLGFAEGLVVAAHGVDVEASFLERSWAGGEQTRLEVTWSGVDSGLD